MSARSTQTPHPDDSLGLDIDVTFEDVDEVELTDEDFVPVESASDIAARELSTHIEAALKEGCATLGGASLPAPPPLDAPREVERSRRLAPRLTLLEEADVADECLASIAREASLARASDPLAHPSLLGGSGFDGVPSGAAVPLPSAPPPRTARAIPPPASAVAQLLPPASLPPHPRTSPARLVPSASDPYGSDPDATLPRPMNAPFLSDNAAEDAADAALSTGAPSLSPVALADDEPSAGASAAAADAALRGKEPTVIVVRDRGRPVWMLASAAVGAFGAIAAMLIALPRASEPAAPAAPAAPVAVEAAPGPRAAWPSASVPVVASARAPAESAEVAPPESTPAESEEAPAHVVRFDEAEAVTVDAPSADAASADAGSGAGSSAEADGTTPSASATTGAAKPSRAASPARAPRAGRSPARSAAPRTPPLPRLPDGSFALSSTTP